MPHVIKKTDHLLGECMTFTTTEIEVAHMALVIGAHRPEQKVEPANALGKSTTPHTDLALDPERPLIPALCITSVFLQSLQRDRDQHAHERCGRGHSAAVASHLRGDEELLGTIGQECAGVGLGQDVR